ncbi:hypothetical protein LAV33_09705 [Bacillus safensis]|uniref:hypothetical protein n=1 Tax=Bacillus TaxID=1386 RepID=UPI000D022CF5|nr:MULTISPECIES: hypothetical protein [Bacillus]MEB2270548.1 hypothetical protein [Bacillus safensis]PRS11912.1 hypothetical protein C6X95_15950 [Bacillus pumilus]PRS28472.1 hypothetical protein C6X99_12425 [Bacillus pumilus]
MKKSSVFSVVMLVLFSFAMVVPTFAKTNYYDFTMEYRAVNGADKKRFYELNKGPAKISGEQWELSKLPNANGPNTVYYELRNKSTGKDYGTVTSRPRADGKVNKVSGKYTGIGGGNKYYLFIYKIERDGRTIKGKGKVSN